MIGISRTTYQYKAKLKDDSEIQSALTTLTTRHVAIGYWECCYRLSNQGLFVNHKKIYRVYTDMKLNIRRRAKRRLPKRVKQALIASTVPNLVWSIDFMSDSLLTFSLPYLGQLKDRLERSKFKLSNMKGKDLPRRRSRPFLKQYEGGRKPMQLCREYGVSKATLFNWRKRYSRMDSTHIKELKALQDENRRLNQMYAELMLHHRLAKHIIEKES